MFEDYTQQKYKESYDCIQKQHNIFVLVGNGFDIAIMNRYQSGQLKGKTTSYPCFYDYVCSNSSISAENVLLSRMKEDKACGKENWSDFENTLAILLNEEKVPYNQLEQCIDEFQYEFTFFLNTMVHPQLLMDLNNDVKDKKLAVQSLGKFMLDIDEDINFPNKTDHYHLYNYVFANFNYTSLLDNYIFTDKGQFDPHIHRYADRNFSFYPQKAISGRSQTIWSSYMVSEVIHPHGIQDVPRSILFGVDIKDYDKGDSLEKRLVKSYWAQYDVKYKAYLEKAELFIIYGMSLGTMDAWWLDKIYDALLTRDAELIIYMFGNAGADAVIELFFKACIRHSGNSEEDKSNVAAKIVIVEFTANDTYFLGLEKKD